MKNMWKYWIVLFFAAGCGVQEAVYQDKTLLMGSPEERKAETIVKGLAVKHGYHPEKMKLEVKSNADTGDFLFFLFPPPLDAQNLRREDGLFAIVKAKSGQVIRFSDPVLGPEK